MRGSPIEILRRHGLRAKHSWGQNFLSDARVLERIAELAELAPGEVAVEIGPGLGHLTEKLLETGARIVAIERDHDMVKVLGELAGPNLTVVEANAAKAEYAKAAGVERVTVVGNLPYHLTSPILFQILDQQASVTRAVFTVQKEVADRLSAEPGGRDYGLLSVLLGLHFDVESVLELPRGYFHPPPKVDSSVIRLTHLDRPRAEVDEALFRRVVKAGFAHRRKTLSNTLKSDKTLGEPETIARALAAAQIDGGRRAETLSVEEFAAIARALGPTVAAK
jgi:16S rRNA (adenine1518-N6/adenine1519-N6)-dimethyltransferase